MTGVQCSRCYKRMILLSIIRNSRLQPTKAPRIIARHMSSNKGENEVMHKKEHQQKGNNNDSHYFGERVTASNIGRIVSEATTVYLKPSKMDKQILFWAGKYKSKEEIPEMVKLTQLDAARDKMRMLTSLWILIGALLSCLFIIYVGSKRYNKYLDEKYKENVQMWADMNLIDKDTADERKRPTGFKK